MAADPDIPSMKRFVPLENNPEVMSSLVHELGLSTKLRFHDVYSLFDDELLGFIPRPAHALLLVFPLSRAYEDFQASEDALLPPYSGRGPSEPVLWFRQTIANACGLIALLHAVCNGPARASIGSQSELARLIVAAEGLEPAARARLLENSDVLEGAHQRAAQQGVSSAPLSDSPIDLHYVCFVKSSDGRLWELDGRRKGPLDRGFVGGGDDGTDGDVLSSNALDAGPRAFVRREGMAGDGELRFSLIALAETSE